MTDIAPVFVDKSRNLLLSDYLPKIESCLARLSAEDVWWRPNGASNSIGNLMLHLQGNVTQWIVGGLGNRPFERHRQGEFDERRQLPSSAVFARLKAVTEEAADIIGAMDNAALLERYRIQSYDVTALEAIYHVVEHFGMHTGQIILLAKARTGQDLQLWRLPEHLTSL